jgi:GT2 family glycosyltransferase
MCTAIIILNYNNYFDTKNCIDSVMEHNTANIKIIVVDNGSYDECVSQTGLYLKDKFPTFQTYKSDDRIINHLSDCSFILSKTNTGYAQGNNIGLKFAYQDSDIQYVMILNNDVLFIEDIIQPLTNHIDVNKDSGIISPLLLKRDGKTIDYNCARKNIKVKDLLVSFMFFYFDPFKLKNQISKKQNILDEGFIIQSKEKINIELPSGSCMLMKISLCQSIDGFDPNTFLYYEENILYKKIQNIGMKNYLLTQFKCVHLGASSTSKIEGIKLLKASVDSAAYYINRYSNTITVNKLLFLFIRAFFLLQINVQQKIKSIFN